MTDAETAIREAREAMRHSYLEAARAMKANHDPTPFVIEAQSSLDHYTALIRADERVMAQDHTHMDGCLSPSKEGAHANCTWCKKQFAAVAALQAIIEGGKDARTSGRDATGTEGDYD